MVTVKNCIDMHEWNDHILDHEGHPLQLWGWGETKSKHGWTADRVFIQDGDITIGAAQLLIKKLPGNFKSLAYIPRGPVCAKENRGVVLEKLAEYAASEYKALALTIEPHWLEFDAPQGWKKSNNTILAPRTLILDLNKSEEDLQADMAKKTRQYIRKSTREAIDIRRIESQDEVRRCLAVYHETANRANFALHGNQYYLDIFDNLGEASPVYGAFYEGKIVAFLWLAVSNEVAFELYGGVTDQGQVLRANYALKWRAITDMKASGVRQYDMNGLINDGISSFKQGFANHEDMLIGTYDKPLSPLYQVWNRSLPLAKKIVRTIKNR